MSVEITQFDMAAPDDVSGLIAMIDRIGATAIMKLALFVKVEGAYDDGSRERARRALDGVIVERGLTERALVLIAVGCEGVATPFGYALVERALVERALVERALVERAERIGAHLGPQRGPPRLAIGFARSAPPAPALLGQAALASTVATTVRTALHDASLTTAQVAMVFVKVPQPAGTSEVERVRGRRTRAVAALGAGIALGEVDPATVVDAALGTDRSIYSRRVQNFAGAEVDRAEVIVLGNRPGAGGDLVACGSLMNDLIDAGSIKRMLIGAGLVLDPQGELAAPQRIAALFVKAGPNADGSIRGARTTIYGSALAPEQHMRSALSGLLAGITGSTRFFHTGDPIHAAPDGGGVACAVIRVDPGVDSGV